jgi:hypothetical protein
VPPPVTAPTELAEKPAQTQEDKDMLAAFDLLNKSDIPGAQKLAAGIRKRNPKHPQLALLTTTIETRLADEKKREEAVAAANAAAAALEEEKKKAAVLAEEKRIAEEKAKSAPAFTVAPGGGFVAESAPPSPLLRGQAERHEIEKAVAQWAAAFSKLDVKALSEIRALSPDEARRWQNTFNAMSSYKLNVRLVGDPQVIDNEAMAPVEEIAVYTAKRGGISITQQPVKQNYRLRKIGNEWKLLVPSTPMPPNPSQQ